MYKLAVSISARIQRLALQFFDGDRPHLTQISKICTHLSMPSLSELKLICSNAILGRGIRSICRNWDMPSLQKLTLKDVLPILPESTPPRIKALSLEASRSSEPALMGAFLTREIVNFLLSLPSVEHLRVVAKLSMPNEMGFIQVDEHAAMESVRTLDLGLQSTEVANGANLLHIISFPGLESFRVELRIKDLEGLDEVLENVNFKIPPTSVTNVTVAIGRELEDSDSASQVYSIGKWCEQFGDVKSLRLESKRDITHGLFAFANPFDALDIVNEEGSVINGAAVEDIPFVGKWNRGPRKAIIDAQKNVEYIDGYISDTDFDSDF